jgi:transcription-repair coupling factor (superfamily II helicase)
MMAAQIIDNAMLRSADGDGDVLLTTNIIESGLDLPRANTILIWHPERYGLAQHTSCVGESVAAADEGLPISCLILE